MAVGRKQNPYETLLKELEKELDRLRAAYEMHFQGRERMPPNRLRDRFDRRIRELRKELPQNTALKFRVQTLWSRYSTLKSYWGRITRQIEEGTYKRHLQRVQRKRAKQPKRAEAASVVEIDVDLDGMSLDMDLDAEVGEALEALQEDKTEPNISVTSLAAPAEAPAVSATFGRPRVSTKPDPPRAVPPRKRPLPQGRPAPSSSSGSDTDMRRLYDKYIEAKRQNKERTDVKFETLQRQIQKMVPKLKEKHRGKKIDFEVVVRNGKVGLKPVTKK